MFGCRLVDETIGWYVWREKIRACHRVITKHVHVDEKYVKNRILNVLSIITNWRRTGVKTWDFTNMSGVTVEMWGVDNLTATYTSKWQIDKIVKTKNSYKTEPLHYSEDPTWAKNHPPLPISLD